MTKTLRGCLAGALLIGTLLIGPMSALAADSLALPDEAARWRTAALIERINADLLTADSATLTLERWCADHHMANPATVTVDRIAGAAAPATAAIRTRLAVSADTPLGYRKVRLVCGGHVLSEAENWYVPGRLTQTMNAALDGSDTPFGKVIRPLGPSRKTLGLVRDWSPTDRAVAATEAPSCDRQVFSHEAVVLDRDGHPLALVAEHYRLELICAIKAP